MVHLLLEQVSFLWNHDISITEALAAILLPLQVGTFISAGVAREALEKAAEAG